MIHFRVGRTDGVSLEMGAWREILEKRGWEVVMAGGRESVGADYVIDGLENQHDPEVCLLGQEAFGETKTLSEIEFEKRFLEHQANLKLEFARVLVQAKPDRVIVSNIFSVGENIAAAGALAQALSEANIPTVGVHHDFYWESVRYRKPVHKLVERQLERYFPPVGIKHVCINSIAKTELLKRKGFVAEILPDTLDFGYSNIDANGACAELLRQHGVKLGEDVVVLQATRIVRRKNIELAMDVVAEMQKLTSKRVVLVMAGYAEKRDEAYQKELQDYVVKLGILTVELNGLASNYVKKTGTECDLMSIYPYVDVVTYTSLYEGFGNQFLEAIYAKKPVVAWEYPVFKTDIKPVGFDVISLGDKLPVDRAVIERVAREALERKIDVEENFRLGKENYSYEAAGKIWDRLL